MEEARYVVHVDSTYASTTQLNSRVKPNNPFTITRLELYTNVKSKDATSVSVDSPCVVIWYCESTRYTRPFFLIYLMTPGHAVPGRRLSVLRRHGYSWYIHRVSQSTDNQVLIDT